MKNNLLTLTVVSTALAFLVGCQSAPMTAHQAGKRKVPENEKEMRFTNMSVSEAKGISSPFKTENGTIFPENKMGYKLILTSDIAMPNLLATQLPNSDILVQMRIYNRADYPQTLNIVCARGEDRSTYQANAVVFPANRARDIRFTVNERDSQNLSLIVTNTR